MMVALHHAALQHLLSHHAAAQGAVGQGRPAGQHPVHHLIELPRSAAPRGLAVVLDAPVLQLHLLDLLPALIARPVDALLPQHLGDAVEDVLVAQAALQLHLHRLVGPELQQLHHLGVRPVTAALVLLPPKIHRSRAPAAGRAGPG